MIFGADENCDLTISQAVQASTALPIFYKPPRFNGVDYMDGGIRNTANIDVAIEKGADLIICYNPFRPFLNRIDDEQGASQYFSAGRYLSDRGLKVVLNQVFRTLLHSRLKLALQRYLADRRFQGDIVLLEPRDSDAEFFAINPLAFWKRAQAIREGFESVRETIEQNYDQLATSSAAMAWRWTARQRGARPLGCERRGAGRSARIPRSGGAGGPPAAPGGRQARLARTSPDLRRSRVTGPGA